MFRFCFQCHLPVIFTKSILTNKLYPLTSHFRSNASICQALTWESVVGLEIHAQINAKSKLFSSSAALFKKPTNSQVSYFDAALPGCLPILNKYCVEAGVLTALALNCEINKFSTFDRKHYFYPDLPAGYQITQQFMPLASKGYIKFHVYDKSNKSNSYDCLAHIKQLQLEQDSGRSFHIEGHRSLVDLNRAGIGLMELVFEPDLKNGSEAAALVKELILILRCIDVCTCEMEEGALRVDANISVNRPGEPFGIRTEVKNINSVRYISRAIDFEIDRQIKILESGGFVSNETRSYDYALKKTIFMRDKETLQDYRFMPEPNLPPIVLYDDSDSNVSGQDDVINIDQLKRKLPTLPGSERLKLMNNYGLSYEAADRILTTEGLKTVFEEVSSYVKNYECVTGFLFFDVQHQLNVRKLSYTNCPVTSIQIANIIELLEQRTISELTAKDILEMLCNGDTRTPAQIVSEYNWHQIFEGEELIKLCKEAMVARPKMVQKYRKSRKWRYMYSLLQGLNEIANNRACHKDAEKVFIKLICGEKEAAKALSEDPSHKESKNPSKS